MNNRVRMTVVSAGLLVGASAALGQFTTNNGPVEPPAVGPGVPVPEGPAPKLVLEKTSVDFGRILDDQVTDFVEVPFRNEGEGTLIITNLRASCGCTVGELDKREYAPGEAGAIRVQFKPEGKSNFVRQTVTIDTNDASLTNSQATVEVKAFVLPIVRVDPGMVNLGVLRKGEFVSTMFNVIGLSPDFEVVGLDVSGTDGLSAEIIDRQQTSLDEGREGWSVEIELLSDGSAKPGMIRGHVRIRTNDPRRESVGITVSGQVLGDIAVSEPQIRIGNLEMGDSFEKTFRVESRSGTPFKISGFQEQSNLDQKGEWIATPVGESAEPTAYDVTMKVTAPDRPGMVRGTVIMQTDMTDETRIQLLFFGIIRPEAVDGGPANAVRPTTPPTQTGGDATKTGGK